MTKGKTPATGRLVYSYIRFSTPEQELGDSERRQFEDAQRWCEKHRYTLISLIDRGEIDEAMERYLAHACRPPRAETFASDLLDAVGELDPTAYDDPVFSEFLDEVTARRMSKDGRFLRIHFKGGMWIDVVPPGSLASGKQLVRRKRGRVKWEIIRPELHAIWEEVKKRHSLH